MINLILDIPPNKNDDAKEKQQQPRLGIIH